MRSPVAQQEALLCQRKHFRYPDDDFHEKRTAMIINHTAPFKKVIVEQNN
jgi:hypothetical protein